MCIHICTCACIYTRVHPCLSLHRLIVPGLSKRCVRLLVTVVEEDKEWAVVDAACAAVAAVVVRFPDTVHVDGGGGDDDADATAAAAAAADAAAEDTHDVLPSSSSIALKMFSLLPLNIGHASSVLVALMRVESQIPIESPTAACSVARRVEQYVRCNVRAYTSQNFSKAMAGRFGAWWLV